MDFLTEIDKLPPGSQYAIVAALFVVLLVIFKLAFGRNRGDDIVVIGPCGGGKTSLFLQLYKGDLGQGTVTSMEANQATFNLTGVKKAVKMVDVPGHRRVRSVLDKHIVSARAIIFMVDAVDFSTTGYVRSAADMLYDALSKRSLQRSRVPVLVACNKMDYSSAHSVDFVRKRLEKEIEQLRNTRTAMSDTGKGGASEEGPLGKPGHTFSFANSVNPVTFCGISVTQNELGPLFDFIKAINK
mmetsp:Transcript_27374/g.52120  ORF Transcript_27374/g.52120 Transcript_27374/m.52120 type:complete len:242 (+) Transcript_27374:61-786(+)